MIKSMTGFGRGTAGQDDTLLAVTVKTYNSRFLDIKIRGVEQDPAVEAEMRELLQTRLVRGSIYVTIERDQELQKQMTFAFNRARFEALENIIVTVYKEYGRQLNISDLVTMDDLLIQTEETGYSPKIILKALDKAVKQVESMRLLEGGRLAKDLVQRLKQIQDIIEEVAGLAADSAQTRNNKYTERIRDLLQGIEVDETRVAQEIAFLAERADITEEIVRCRSHFDQSNQLMKMDEPVGKRFNFLLQEIGREINTIGSKNSVAEIAALVITLKDEIEKMREQVQNIL